jgi:3-methyladenine DNA glycosylase AlkC
LSFSVPGPSWPARGVTSLGAVGDSGTVGDGVTIPSSKIVERCWPDRGARSKDAVHPLFLDYLEAGVVESRTHVEQMAMSMGQLLRNTFPDVDATGVDALPFITRLREIGGRIHRQGGAISQSDRCWLSDTVRGWLALSIVANKDASTSEVIQQLRPFARDHHFAVREWAWLAARPRVVAEAAEALRCLAECFRSEDARERRFAIEATRPRSVWGSHAPTLVRYPELAEASLTWVRCETDPYPLAALQNWLSDARRSRPDWVAKLTSRWAAECDCAAAGRLGVMFALTAD